MAGTGEVLAYVFWHRPREDAGGEEYERAVAAFHRSLAHRRPAGLIASALFALAELPWQDGADAARQPWYEDWYVLEDYAALGVLNEAAVGLGHRTSHDEAARRAGAGAGGVYALIEGEASADALALASLAVWVSHPPGQGGHGRGGALAELLGDGMPATRASLWRRQLVLGPAPEYCVLAGEAPEGVGAARLPEGWSARTLAQSVLWSG